MGILLEQLAQKFDLGMHAAPCQFLTGFSGFAFMIFLFDSIIRGYSIGIRTKCTTIVAQDVKEIMNLEPAQEPPGCPRVFLCCDVRSESHT
jgi:hypothetical protein